MSLSLGEVGFLREGSLSGQEGNGRGAGKGKKSLGFRKEGRNAATDR